MKKLLYLLLSATVFACSSEHESEMGAGAPENPEGLKYHAVTFDLQGELAEFSSSEEPLTKADAADTADLYVINVYSKPATGGNYSQYAYGTFDRKEGMTVNLLEGNLYRFEVTMIRDAREVLYWTSDSTYYWWNQDNKLLNRFIINSWGYAEYGASTSDLTPLGGPREERGIRDRYYGELTDYAPVENGKIAVDLYRAVFGVRVNVNGLTEGKLDFKMQHALSITISADALYTPDNIHQLYYLADVVEFAPQGLEQTEEVFFTVTWTNAAGDRTIQIYDGSFTATRLKRTIFNITLKQGVASPNDVDFVIVDEGEIMDGNVENIEGTINGGEDVEINPGA